MKKNIIVFLSVSLIALSSAPPIFAHVTVKPSEVNIAQRTNFSVSVPTEEDNPTIAVKLIIPDGVQSVRPNVKPGWKIELKKTGQGEDVKVSEIIWTGGNIPVDQKDEFIFSAQAPANGTTIVWKAYQTYSDGDIVAWENDPKVVEEYTKNNPAKEGDDNHDAPRSYSTTKVVDDLSKSTTAPQANTNQNEESTQTTQGAWMSYSALALSAAALALTLQNKKRSK
jgi:uncharacterized protein YcnI